MAISHEFQFRWTRGGETITKTVSVTSDGEDNRDIDVPNPSTNLAVDFEVDVSQLKGLYIVSNKALTLKTNSSSSPQETISLAADKPLTWVSGLGNTLPFAGDVTSLFVSNASGAAAVLSIRMLFDSTP